MKKYIIVFVFIAALIGLSSCKKAEKISILVPSGSPAFAQLYLEEKKETYDVMKISGPDNIPAYFNEAEKDIIIAPTNIGIKLYMNAKEENKEFQYELGANVVFGNQYILSREEITINDLNGKVINAYGKNATPGITLRHILNAYNITPSEINYLPGGIDSQHKFLEDENAICLVPEPAASAAIARLEKSNITVYRINILDLYNEHHNTEEGFPQASVFIKKSLSKKTKNKILKDLKNSINKVNDNVSDAADLAISLEYKTPKPVLLKAIPYMNLRYLDGNDAKNALEKYFQIIINDNPKVIGTELPDKNFYYGIKD